MRCIQIHEYVIELKINRYKRINLIINNMQLFNNYLIFIANLPEKKKERFKEIIL